MTTPLPAGSLRATSLNLGRRENDLAALGDGHRLDVLVVGGGVTGAGAALDAAARGLSVALVEAEDLAWGASRWSSQLLDGGLRHLSRGDLVPARESAVERGILMTRTAPHLTHALPQLLPLHERVSRRAEGQFMAGLLGRDALRRGARTPPSVLPPPHRAPVAEVLALVPGLRRNGLRGGLLGFEGHLVDDARLVLALARTAAGFGARVLTRVRATALHHDGAQVLDVRTGTTLRLRASAVINATGVWAAELDPHVRFGLRRATHLVVDADAAGIAGTALLWPTGSSGAHAYLVPQPEGHALLGTTDEPVDGSPGASPTVPESDVDALLGSTRDVLADPLDRSHVLGSFAGLRACTHSRHAAVTTGTDGIVTGIADSVTTYRRVATDAVDTAVKAAGLPAGPSRTRAVPLVGAADPSRLDAIDAPPRLVARYGTEASRITALTELDPDLAEPVAPGETLTAAEVLWAVRHEGAVDAEDVLDRRSGLGLTPAARHRARPTVEAIVSRALHGVDA